MSTRSFIALQLEEDKFKTIYCHSDGYLTYNGAMLIDHYNDRNKVEELISLGDISCLDKKIAPDPNFPHNFDYGNRQDDVVVAYGRDRGDKHTEAQILSLKQLDAPSNWTEFIYIFTLDNKWKYFEAGHSAEGLRDVENDLIDEYIRMGINRPNDFYGFLSDSEICQLKAEQEAEGISPPAISL